MRTMETISATHAKPRENASFVRVLKIIANGAASRLARYVARHRSRRALMELNDEQLKDIGISRGDAYREGIRAFWE